MHPKGNCDPESGTPPPPGSYPFPTQRTAALRGMGHVGFYFNFSIAFPPRPPQLTSQTPQLIDPSCNRRAKSLRQPTSAAPLPADVLGLGCPRLVAGSRPSHRRRSLVSAIAGDRAPFPNRVERQRFALAPALPQGTLGRDGGELLGETTN